MIDLDAFVSAMREHGIEPPDHVVADGRLHRFSSNGKRGDAAGWYVLFDGERPAGAYGCWRLGVSGTWHARGEPLSTIDREAFAAKLQAAREARRQADVRKHDDAAKRAWSIWSDASEAALAHPYLLAKGVGAYGLRQHGRTLLVPLCDNADRLWSLQSITPEGAKKFLPGGRTRGLYHVIEGSLDKVYIAEGYATAASIHEIASATVCVAFSAHNLVPVAEHAKRRWPRSRFIVAADNDQFTPGNPGVTMAQRAAVAIGAAVVIPEFDPAQLEHRPTDFNDLVRLERAQHA